MARQVWRYVAGLGAFVVAFAVHQDLKARVCILNLSPGLLSHVRIRGRGFEKPAPDISSSASECVVVDPSGESSVEFLFDAGGRSHRHTDIGYIEPNRPSRVHIVVTASFEVEANGHVFELK